MRILSFVPAATDWLIAFGASQQVVGRTHRCRMPVKAQGEVLTEPAAVPDASDGDAPRGAIHVDWNAARAAGADLVIAGNGPEALVTPEEVEAELSLASGAIYGWRADTMKDVLDAALEIARRTDRLAAAMEWIGRREQALARLGERWKEELVRPRTLLLQEAGLSAGRWAPDLVELAGGIPMLSERGEPPQPVGSDAFFADDPDVVVFASPSKGREEVAEEAAAWATRFAELKAVRSGRVFCLDGRRYLHRPGPDLYTTVRLLASVLHPDRVEPSDRIVPLEGGKSQ